MAARTCHRRRCLSCNELFTPNSRNRTCSQAPCRKASKKASQARWSSKPANRQYFSGNENTERNRKWRAENPGYWRRSQRSRTQQDTLTRQPTDNQRQTPNEISCTNEISSCTQQDPETLQLILFLGLIANLTTSTQQDIIDLSMRRIHDLGCEVLKHAGGNSLLSVMLGSLSPHTP